MLKALVAEWCEGGDANIQWSTIANKMPGRSGKQCRERWSYSLRPNIKKGDWSQAEDQLLDTLQRQLGNKWTMIAASIPGRTDNDVKNRWHARKKSAAVHQRYLATATSTTKATHVPKSSQPFCGKVIDKFPIRRSSANSPPQKAKAYHRIAAIHTSEAALVRSCTADSILPPLQQTTRHHATAIHANDAAFVRSCSADSTIPPQRALAYHHTTDANTIAFVQSCSADSKVPIDHRMNAVYADDIFSPSYFPRQLRMSTAIAYPATEVMSTPFTPLMVLADVSSCHSGPFISNTEEFNLQTLECVNGRRQQFGSSQDEDRVNAVGMTPLPYKTVENSDESKEGSSSPRILLGVET